MANLTRLLSGPLLVIAFGIAGAAAGESPAFVVDAGGKGDFRTIQMAIDAVPSGNQADVVVLVRNGVYSEKVFIQKSHITLVGENWDSTRIVYAELRENWNTSHKGSDWGSAVVNIDTGVTDITLANLTVYNNYGWENNVFNKHQFAIRGLGTRIMLLHCKVISDGGDALSLWNKQNGMYYHADCYFEGWVDYVCPRGWCYIVNSQFFGHNLSASIWHDGDYNKSEKFVIRNSSFDGVPGFPLGRNHRDGQIFLLGCRFSERMADRPMYHPPSSKTAWQWGPRHYYFDCHRDGGDYGWFKDNLKEAEGAPNAAQITAKWTFDGQWDPEANMPSLLRFAFLPQPDAKATGVDPGGTRLKWVPGRDARMHRVFFGPTNPPVLVRTQSQNTFEPGTLKPGRTYFWRVDEVTPADTVAGSGWSFTTAVEESSVPRRE